MHIVIITVDVMSIHFLQISNLIEAVSLLSGVKLDPATLKHDASKMPTIPPHPKSAASSVTETRTPSAKTRVTSSSMRHVKTPATLKTYEMPIQPLVGLKTSFLVEKTMKIHAQKSLLISY